MVNTRHSGLFRYVMNMAYPVKLFVIAVKKILVSTLTQMAVDCKGDSLIPESENEV